MLVAQSARLFGTPWTASHQAPLFMGFSMQGYWNGLPFPSPGGPPNQGIKPGSPALQADSLQTELQEKALLSVIKIHLFVRLALQLCNGALQLYPVFYGNWKIWFVGTRSRQKNGFYSRYLNYFISLMKSTLVNWNTSLARALWPVHSYLLIHCEFWVLEH